MSASPFVQSVFHPTDFSPESHAAFRHALALVLYHQARFTMLHIVAPDQALDVWTDAPRVRQTLERWNVLAPGSRASDLPDKLSLFVDKVNVRSADPLLTMYDELESRPSDLIVLANEEQRGLPRWIHRSMAADVARRSPTMTLFVPPHAQGFVSRENGTIRLERVLVPIDHAPPAHAAIQAAARAAVMSLVTPVEIVLLRVGDAFDWPDVTPPDLHSCSWTRAHRAGNPVEEIVSTADAMDADLIVMTTAGARGILDALRGTVTENVLRKTTRPVLAVPIDRALPERS